ncbi:HupE/UreJ family protein [soil metagenome]
MQSTSLVATKASRSKLIGVAFAGIALLAPALSFAHVGADAGSHHGVTASVTAALTQGFAHPFTGLDHLLAMVALGVWAATCTRRMWAAPVAFVSMMLVGALLGQAGVALPAVEPMIGASLLVIGLLAATRAQLPTAAGVVVAGVFALFHGAAHGQEFGGASGAAVLAGMVVATCVLHSIGLAAGCSVRSSARASWTVWLPRAAGAAVAAFGVSMLTSLA